MTKFKGAPLFGKENSPQRSSNILSLIGTFIFWLLFLIISICIKPTQKAPAYKEVQIVLASPKAVEKTKEAPAPAEPASSLLQSEQTQTPSVQETPKEAASPVKESNPPATVPKKTETPKQKTEKTKAAAKTPAKSIPAPVSAEPIEYAVDPMEAFNNQVANKPKKKPTFDELFGDNSTVQEKVKTEQEDFIPIKPVESSFSGSAATTVSDTNVKKTSTSEKKSETEKTSSKTSTALGKIANATYKGIAASGIQTESAVKAQASGSGKVLMQMADGTQRALIEPAEPIINLSKKAANTIDGNKMLSISFRIVDKGTVPRGEIQIKPEASVSEIVREEIKNQISSWRFETADFVSTATFEYRIIKQ